jgi:phage baseplate assembly protein W
VTAVSIDGHAVRMPGDGARGGLAFPFTVDSGRVGAAHGDAALRGRIVQVLFTAPGERVDLPDFGCGLFQLVFEPNDELVRAAMSFTVVQALTRWLGEEIVVDGVDITLRAEQVAVEVAYTRRADLRREGLRVQFQGGAAWQSR